MPRFVEPPGTPEDLVAVGYDGTTWDHAVLLARGQVTTGERMPSIELLPDGDPAWMPEGPSLDVDALVIDDPLTGRPLSGAQFLDRRLCTDGLLVVHRGACVYETYRNGMLPGDRHVNHSTTKTLTSMLVGIAVGEGVIDVDTPMADLIPELAEIPAWSQITLQHVLDMASGLDVEEHYEDPGSMYWRYADAVGYYEKDDTRPRQGVLGFAVTDLTHLIEPPGSRFNYASYLTNLIPIAVGNAYGIDPLALLEERIYQHLGAEAPALLNVDDHGRGIVEGQLNLTLRDFTRWAWPFRDGGRALTGDPVIPPAWIEETLRASESLRAAFQRSDYVDSFPGPHTQYHNQAWILDPNAGVMAMLGIHGQFCYLDLPRDLMIVGYSSYPDQTHPLMGASMFALWDAVKRTVEHG